MSLLVAACGGDDDDSDADSTSATTGSVSDDTSTATTGDSEPADTASDDTSATETTATTATTDAPAGDADTSAVLTVGTDITTTGGPYFDSADFNGNNPAMQWMELIYDTMIRRTADDGAEPGLAVEWSAPDDSTVDITLREGVTFQDGTPFDAAAVARAWTRPKPPTARPETKAIVDVEVVGPLQVRVHLSAPLAGTFINVQMKEPQDLSVPSPAALDQYGDDYRNHPVGAGPYAFDSYDVDQAIHLRAWDGYWDPESQRMAGVDFVQISPGAPAVTALASGQIDLAWVAPTDAAAVEGQDGLMVTRSSSDSTLSFNLCTNKPPFDSLEARQALAHLVDREAYNEGGFAGEGIPTDQLFAPDSPFYNADVADAYPHDVDTAQQLWEQSGAPNELTIMAPSAAPVYQLAAEILQAELGEIGVTAEIIPTEDVVTDLPRINPDVVLFVPRSTNLSPYLNPGAPVNWCGYDNPAVTAAIGSLFTSTDEQPYQQARLDLATAISEDLPLVWLVNQPVMVGHTESVQGIEVLRAVAGQSADLRTVSIAAG